MSQSVDLEGGCGSSVSSSEEDTTMVPFGERTADTDASEEEDSNVIQIGGAGN